MKSSPSRKIKILKKEAIKIVEKSQKGLTSRMLAKKLKKAFSTDKKSAAYVIKELVNQGELEYMEQHGHTVLCAGLNKPFAVSSNIILKPPEISYSPENSEVVINLNHGVSFGSGHHPTTRLSIRVMDYILKQRGFFKGFENSKALDIGTGSGVLAVCALKLGIKKGLGLDIDPCAIKEAKDNALLNGLLNRLEISAKPLDEINEKFELIIANLRLPTLVGLSREIHGLCRENTCLVFSGIKTDEIDCLDRAYAPYFKKIRRETEKGWAGVGYLSLKA